VLFASHNQSFVVLTTCVVSKPVFSHFAQVAPAAASDKGNLCPKLSQPAQNFYARKNRRVLSYKVSIKESIPGFLGVSRKRITTSRTGRMMAYRHWLMETNRAALV
jgi:hypothetical protein